MARSLQVLLRRLLVGLPLLAVLLWTLAPGLRPARVTLTATEPDAHACPLKAPWEAPERGIQDDETLEVSEEEEDPEPDPRCCLIGVEISFLVARCDVLARDNMLARANPMPMTGAGSIRGPPHPTGQFVRQNMS